MTIAANKSVVRRYFEDVLDGGHVSLVEELFAPDCVVHRPELPEPLVGREQVTAYVGRRPSAYSHSVTSFEHLIAEGDLVAVRLRHDVTYRADWQSRAGKIAALQRLAGDLIHLGTPGQAAPRGSTPANTAV